MVDEVIVESTTLGDALNAAYDDATKEVSAEDSSESVAETSVEATEVSPPEHWSKEDQEVFMGMDESGRDWALRLETNASKGIQEKSEELKKFRDTLEPHKHLFQGGDEITGINNLLNAQSFLNRNPVEGIKWLMKSYGVDEKQFAPSDVTQDEFADPDVEKLRAEINELKLRSEQQSNDVQQRQQQALLAQIDQFRDDVDDSGEKTHPHFQEVYGVMSGLLQSGRAEDLETAYEQAVWTFPEYRDSVVQKKAEEQAKKDIEAKTQKADEADKTAKTVNGKSSAKVETKPKTMAQSLSEAYEKSVNGEL